MSRTRSVRRREAAVHVIRRLSLLRARDPELVPDEARRLDTQGRILRRPVSPRPIPAPETGLE